MTSSVLARRVVKYGAVSALSLLAGQLVLVTAFGVLGWSARASNLASFPVGTMVSYWLNRSWVWGKKGRTDMVRDVTAFWLLALAGLALSTWAVGIAERRAASADFDRAVAAAFVAVTSLAAYGTVWIFKFVALNWVLFGRPTETGSQDELLVAHDQAEEG